MDVVVHDTVDSTSSWCLQQCRSGRSLPFACFAEEQTSGRGRRGNQWLMAANNNIALSICWPFSLSSQQLNLLPLSVAMAIVETLESVNLSDVQIKWPNDVYVRNKKIAGILIETIPLRNRQAINNSCTDHATYAMDVAGVIGVGLNYDMSAFAADGSEQQMPELTDIRREIINQMRGPEAGRMRVAVTLLQNIITVCERFRHDATYWRDTFRGHYDYCRDKTVSITVAGGQTVTGVAKGITDAAELIVLVDGKQHIFNSAEVTVRVDAL